MSSNFGATPHSEVYSAQEAESIFQLFSALTHSLDMNKVRNIEQLRTLYNASRPLAAKNSTANHILSTFLEKILCLVCKKRICTVELLCKHCYCQRCFQRQLEASTGGLVVTNPGETAATCYCGQRIFLEDLQQHSQYTHLVEAAKQRLRPLQRHAGAYVQEEPRESRNHCKVCGLNVTPHCLVQTDCCRQTTCVVCQAETSENCCVHCNAVLSAAAAAQVQEAKKQLKELEQWLKT